MRFLLIACLFPLLASCSSGDSYVVRSRINGHWQIDARAHVDAGIATFECRHSASGTCHFTLFENTLLNGSPFEGGCRKPDASAACNAKVLDTLSVTVDRRAQRRGLSGFRLCASDRAGEVWPDCSPRDGA